MCQLQRAKFKSDIQRIRFAAISVGTSRKSFFTGSDFNDGMGDDYFGSDRVVDDLMRRVRQKMPNLSVETIYGYGYRLLV